MLYLMKHFLKRLFREGPKSLSVPLLAFVLVFLINLMGAIKTGLEADYVDLLDNFPIIAELSDLNGDFTDGLRIEQRMISLFTSPDAPLSLYEYVRGDIELKRTLHTEEAFLTGVTAIGEDVTFFEGFDGSALRSNDPVCVVSEDMLPEGGALRVTMNTKLPDEDIWGLKEGYFEEYTQSGWQFFFSYFYIEYDFEADPPKIEKVYVEYTDAFEHTVIEGETIFAERELTVIGTVPEAGMVYVPWLTVNEFANEIDGRPHYTESLRATVRNWSLATFKTRASLSFPRVRPIHDTRPFAMTIYDSVFYETLEPLRQNIILVDVATPFIYAIAICVGFLTSILLTRRRKPEFAVMRSVGIHKRDIFVCALFEQAVLSAAGAAAGCVLVAAVWGYLSFERPAVFLGCFVFGALFSAIRAAGTNVLKIMRAKEQH
jgi:hypothetical protein